MIKQFDLALVPAAKRAELDDYRPRTGGALAALTSAGLRIVSSTPSALAWRATSGWRLP